LTGGGNSAFLFLRVR